MERELPEINLPDLGPNIVSISERSVDSSDETMFDTEGEGMTLSERKKKSQTLPRNMLYLPRNDKLDQSVNTLLAPDINSLREAKVEDVKEFNRVVTEPEIVAPLKNMDGYYSHISQSFLSDRPTIRSKLDFAGNEFITDVEDFEMDQSEGSDAINEKEVMKYSKIKCERDSTDEDDFETSDVEFHVNSKSENENQIYFDIQFVETSGKPLTASVIPGVVEICPIDHIKGESFISHSTIEEGGGTTDIEVLKSSGSSEEDSNDRIAKNNILRVHAKVSVDTTDAEELSDSNNDFSDSNSSHEFEELSVLPKSIREMVIIKEDKSGRPVSVVVPLVDSYQHSLFVPGPEVKLGTTDVEEVSGISEDENGLELKCPLRNNTPDLPDFERGVVESVEMIKTQDKKLKVSVGRDGLLEPFTDTEDILLEGGTGSRRRRLRSKGGKHKNSLHPSLTVEERPSTTDIEEIEMSDTEALIKNSIKHEYKQISVPEKCSNLEGKTDVEDIDLSEEEYDDGPNICSRIQRAQSVTPDLLRYMEYETVTSKEGSGPFATETCGEMFLEHSILQVSPSIQMTSLSSNIVYGTQTDTEDLLASADEDVDATYSRAEMATPMELGLDIDEGSLSTVHVMQTRKFDLDAPKEAIHIKGYVEIREANTDIEDLGFSEEESHNQCSETLEEQMSVADEDNRVCVCVASDICGDARNEVCVCVGKNQSELSMVWKTGNSTTSTTHHLGGNATTGMKEEWTETSQDLKTEEVKPGKKKI
uniref:Uncharacterized protein n=1 Tax=Timema shepardi TaxID=629360 RepID=A0A7R9B391_TIMSH|nr:unnamed protein product [Timema shepardi]